MIKLEKLLVLFLAAAIFGCSDNSSAKEQASENTTPLPATSQAPQQAAQSAQASASFSKTLTLQGITFNINASNGKLTIQPSGLEASNQPWEHQIEGKVTNAEVEDLNSDGAPEVLVYLSSGENEYADAIAYSCNGKKSMSQIYLPDIKDNAEASKGYQGHDEFAVVETTLARRFPVYENGQPTGATRQLQYKLVDGENSRMFRIDKIVEY